MNFSKEEVVAVLSTSGLGFEIAPFGIPADADIVFRQLNVECTSEV